MPEQRCRVCGCTWTSPCVRPAPGPSEGQEVLEACSWAAPNLCSFCAERESDDEPLVEVFSEAEADALLGGRR